MLKPKLTALIIENFQKTYLRKNFEGSTETAPFHREMWEMACSSADKVAWAAPRGFAKSTAITITYTLASLMFRQFKNVLILSDSESQAKGFLDAIKQQIDDNGEMRFDFGIGSIDDVEAIYTEDSIYFNDETKTFDKETEREIIINFKDGHKCRIKAMGVTQKMRGAMWRGTRPDLVVLDDIEDDETVESIMRREKFKDRFYKQILPIGSSNCKFRMVGTILHFDSLLSNLMNNDAWWTRLWAAHEGFDDFSNLLWETRNPEAKMRAIQKDMINEGKQDAYAQEYLNQPLAGGMSLFLESDMLPIPNKVMREYLDRSEDERGQAWYVSLDLAVSKKTKADLSVFTVACRRADGFLDIVDVIAERINTKEIVDRFFEINRKYAPRNEDSNGLTFIVEKGVIQLSVLPFLNEMMRQKGIFLNIEYTTTETDKTKRSGSIQSMIKAQSVRFDKEANWWGYVKTELLTFPRGAHDDFVDTLSQLGNIVDTMQIPMNEEDMYEEDYQHDYLQSSNDGRNPVTGY